MITPDSIRNELFIVGKELSKAANAIYDLELLAEQADLVAQSASDKVFLQTTGNIEERKAMARERSLDEHHAAVVARASYNRARTKAKHLELEQMRLMASLKSVQNEGA
jgi:hypothetical protein